MMTEQEIKNKISKYESIRDTLQARQQAQTCKANELPLLSKEWWELWIQVEDTAYDIYRTSGVITALHMVLYNNK